MSPVQEGADSLDLGNAVVSSQAVVASPAAAAETIIASITIPVIRDDQDVHIDGWAAFTVGTNGVSTQLKIRRTNVSGTTKADSGAVTAVAANLGSQNISAKDSTGAVVNQVYVMTMQVASGSAPSTVSAVNLRALIL